MNAAARALTQGTLFHGDIKESIFSTETIMVVLLVLMLFVSAFAVICVKNMQRSSFSELQSLIKQSQQLKVERNQLLLEKSTWAVPARIQRLAQERYAMVVLKSPQVIVVQK